MSSPARPQRQAALNRKRFFGGRTRAPRTDSPRPSKIAKTNISTDATGSASTVSKSTLRASEKGKGAMKNAGVDAGASSGSTLAVSPSAAVGSAIVPASSTSLPQTTEKPAEEIKTYQAVASTSYYRNTPSAGCAACGNPYHISTSLLCTRQRAPFIPNTLFSFAPIKVPAGPAVASKHLEPYYGSVKFVKEDRKPTRPRIPAELTSASAQFYFASSYAGRGTQPAEISSIPSTATYPAVAITQSQGSIQNATPSIPEDGTQNNEVRSKTEDKMEKRKGGQPAGSHSQSLSQAVAPLKEDKYPRFEFVGECTFPATAFPKVDYFADDSPTS